MNAPRPTVCTDAMLDYLDKAGTFSLSADRARLAREFPLSDAEAAAVALYWIEQRKAEAERR